MGTIRRNSFFNLLAFALPTAVMLLSYPVLMHHLGHATFGVYILATSFSGTLSFLDFGFAAATVKFVAADLAQDKLEEAAEVILTSIAFYGGLGTLGAAMIWLLSPWLVHQFSIASELQPAALRAFHLAAIQFAIFFLTTVFTSLFKGMQRFDHSALVLTLLSVLNIGGSTLAVLAFHVGLVQVMAISLVANLAVLTIAVSQGWRLCREVGIHLFAARPTLRSFRRMFGFGSFMTINAVASIGLYHVQRYIISATLGPAAVATYQVAFTIPARAHVVIDAMTEVMLPVASTLQGTLELRKIYRKMLLTSLGITIATLVPLLILARPLLTLWVGHDMAVQALPLLILFTVAYFFLALSPAPYHVLNGIGLPWVNTVSCAFNALLNVALIGLFALKGLSLIHFAWAFAIANIVNAIAYQSVVEVVIHRHTSGNPRPLVAAVAE